MQNSDIPDFLGEKKSKVINNPNTPSVSLAISINLSMYKYRKLDKAAIALELFTIKG